MLILMETFECSRFILDKKFVLLIVYFNECVIRDWRPIRFLEIFKNYLEIQKVIFLYYSNAIVIFANGRYMANDVIKVNILFPW